MRGRNVGRDAAVWFLLAAAVVVLATELIIAPPQLGVFRAGFSPLALDPAESRDLSRVLPERGRAYHNLLAAWAARQRGD